MEIKLSNGKKVKLKNLSIDERDELLDSVEYEYTDDNSPSKIKMLHSTMTKFLRIGIDGEVTDEFLKSLSFSDKTDIFTKIQGECMNLGEEEASK
jgi:hypothetical protein